MESTQDQVQNVPINEAEDSKENNEVGRKCTSDYYRTEAIPDRFEHPESFQGYDNKAQHMMYTTTNMRYGSRPPTVHTVPTSFHCKSQRFTEDLGKCGMYRNEGLNTALDHSKI